MRKLNWVYDMCVEKAPRKQLEQAIIEMTKNYSDTVVELLNEQLRNISLEEEKLKGEKELLQILAKKDSLSRQLTFAKIAVLVFVALTFFMVAFLVSLNV